MDVGVHASTAGCFRLLLSRHPWRKVLLQALLVKYVEICLSDVPGLPYYYERHSPSSDYPVYSIIRGTSKLEGYHRWLRACISGSQLSPSMFRDLLLHFNYRWNIRCGVRSRGEKDFSTYSHWTLEAAWQRSRGRVPAGVDFLPGFAPAITRDSVRPRASTSTPLDSI